MAEGIRRVIRNLKTTHNEGAIVLIHDLVKNHGERGLQAIANHGLTHSESVIRDNSIRILGATGRPEFIEKIVKHGVKGKHQGVAIRAVYALNDIGTRKALEAIAKHGIENKSGSGDLQYKSILTLGQSKDPYATDLLIKYGLEKGGLSAKDTSLGLLGIRGALKKTDRERARIIGIEVDTKQRSKIVDALVKHVLKPVKATKVLQKTFIALEIIGAKRAIPRIVEAMRKNPETTEQGIKAIANIGGKKTARVIIENWLGSNIPRFAATSEEELNKMGKEAVKPLITYGLKHWNVDTIYMSILLLSKMGDRRALAPLMMLTDNKDWKVRDGAKLAIKDIQEREKNAN